VTVVDVLSIGTAAPATSLHQRLARGAGFLLKKGVEAKISEIDGKFVNVVVLSLTASPQSGLTKTDLLSLGGQYAVPVLADYLVEELEHGILRQFLEEEFRWFTSEEQDKIIALAREMLSLGEARRLPRQSALCLHLAEFLERNRHINTEGFLHFRLAQYRADLRDALSQAVEEYLAEKEYQEFVRLLRYFVEIQEPKLPVVHVLIDSEGFCQIYDKQYRRLYHEYLESFDQEQDTEASYEDLVISALITLAPHKVVLHRDGSNRAEMYDTIRLVFESRATDCFTCDLCRRALSLPGSFV